MFDRGTTARDLQEQLAVAVGLNRLLSDMTRALTIDLLLTLTSLCCPQTVECGAEDEGGQRDGGEPQHAEQHHQVRVSCSPLISSRYRVDIV